MSTLNIHQLKQLAFHNNLLGNDYKIDNFQPSSYDLRIGSIFKDNEIYSKSFKKPDFINCIDVKPSEIVSIMTLEHVTIPSDCIGTVFAMNSHSSTGLLILNPGHIDPGYSGPISICAINLSKEVRSISIGESIFTLILQKLESVLNLEDAYKNKPELTRKELEEKFLKTTSKKLSNSFFDLVSGYDGAQKMLKEMVWEKFWHYIKLTIKTLAVLGAIASILKLPPADRERAINDNLLALIKAGHLEVVMEFSIPHSTVRLNTSFLSSSRPNTKLPLIMIPRS